MRLEHAVRLLLAALGMVGLAGCAGSPQALGITGPGGGASQATGPGGSGAPGQPGTPQAAPGADDTQVQPAGDPSNFGNRYAPTIGPAYGSDGRYYGYN